MSYIVEGATWMQQLVGNLLVNHRVGSSVIGFAPTDCNAILRHVVSNLQMEMTQSHATSWYWYWSGYL
ncbi:hypothetical protein [Mastigocladopsis repens]|uniref:hypothetical protein n=1 Tax=Mastigocladopsis repens TaxID=221287 RepID=UPI00036D2618|nr:hypothetical protein [Mastigocladopsis repens]